MLAIHWELRGLTASLEMSVFHTLLAGNNGQLRAPGTVVPDAGGALALGAGEGEADALARVVLAAAAAGPAAADCAAALPFD
jgi:hypothetical protein